MQNKWSEILQSYKSALRDNGWADTDSIELPVILQGSEGLSFEIEIYQKRYAFLAITLPCKKSKLLWMPWPESLDKPIIATGGYYNVNFGGKSITMPRRTKCYSQTYSFSGQTHPVEPSTPKEIQELYETTNLIFNTSVNMCLENQYEHGRHYISAHSDDERQFSDQHFVPFLSKKVLLSIL